MRKGKLVTMVMATRHGFLLRIPVSCVVAGDDDRVCVCEDETVVVAVVVGEAEVVGVVVVGARELLAMSSLKVLTVLQLSSRQQ